ncbi:hypothetical protein RB2810 [Rhodopirellula baltica SH 1]|uniref:Uncharacterized protein n=1 Tax=Rhodopirellula baltica (strain DSM 10527 / NCIMB 13988 / SH1) TaxID=243090 RepID=Q7UV84_RHOBA|nr:hypothetical protein RB2810 [Rhodopirellula baltica SH 1]
MRWKVLLVCRLARQLDRSNIEKSNHSSQIASEKPAPGRLTRPILPDRPD